MRSGIALWTLLVLTAALGCDMGPDSGPARDQGFVNFETIPTRALALSPDGRRLFVTNVPDGRLEVFGITPQGLRPEASVPVGLDPIALAVRNDSEVWVVNHLSDSVSVVDVGAEPPRVERTLLVGDEPRDIVFAGPGRSRAFITAARRGQNHPDDTVNETQVPGLGRADVWVFDAHDLGSSLGGDPLQILTLFADKPGAMGVSPDGREVWVTIFTSGNRTTVLNAAAICATDSAMAGVGPLTSENAGPCMLGNGGTSPGGLPAPNANTLDSFPSPRTGLIVKNDPQSGAWLDVLGRDFRDAVPFELPDNDVFVIDADTLAQKRVFQSVGTRNLAVAMHPTNGRAYVANLEAINQNRFVSLPSRGLGPNPDRQAGAALTADPATGKTLRGHLYESRVSILQPNGLFVRRHLNKHIDYEQFPQPLGTVDRSVATPRAALFDARGETLFVAALGSNKIVPFSRLALEFDTFQPNPNTHIRLNGRGGPASMVIDPANENRMFVYKRFDNVVAIVDLARRREVASVPLFNPEPARVQVGRRLFYDARFTSDNGEASCSVCHPAGDKDDIAWNLGIPFLGMSPNPNAFVGGIVIGLPQDGPTRNFNPLKGPMTALTLRGIKDSGPLFWRGDATSATPLDVSQNFRENFPVIFDALNGRTGGIPQVQFEQLTDWILSLVPPPNPYRALDNSLNPLQELGRGVFTNVGPGAKGTTDIIFVCADCHTLDLAAGFFGTGGLMSSDNETQFFKVPALRNSYDKIGMFGHTVGDGGDERTLGGPRGDVGPQVRGTGVQHDGSGAGAEEFLTPEVFQLDAAQLRQVVDFVYAFPSNVAPIVGQQVTLRDDSGADVLARIDLMQQRAGIPYQTPESRFECDLVAKGVVDGVLQGYLFQPENGTFLSDTGDVLSSGALRQQARHPGQAVTFTCVPSGSGTRIGIDRDADGTLDGHEVAP